MAKINLTFYECEHDGDLRNYEGDLVACGAKIIGAGIDYGAEIGHVVIEVDDVNLFAEKFRETDSSGFSQYNVG